MEWYQWVFSGIGAAIILGIFVKVKKVYNLKRINKQKIIQTQKSGNNSSPNQIGIIEIETKK